MERILRYFINNIKFAISMVFIILLCCLSLFFILFVLDFILVTIATPLVSFTVSALFLVVAISVLLTLFDVLFNKGN